MSVTGKLLSSLTIWLILSGCSGSVNERNPSFSSVYRFVDYQDVDPATDSYPNAISNFIADMCYKKNIERYCDCRANQEVCLEIPEIVEALER